MVVDSDTVKRDKQKLLRAVVQSLVLSDHMGDVTDVVNRVLELTGDQDIAALDLEDKSQALSKKYPLLDVGDFWSMEL